MISDYLVQLYTNCKSLAKTETFSTEELNTFFINHFRGISDEINVSSEAGLVQKLISIPYSEARTILNRSEYLTVFYLVNSLSEYRPAPEAYDELGRFRYSFSPAHETGITQNTVMDLIRKTVTESIELQRFFKFTSRRSLFYLSHDIDSIYGSFTQDGAWALKKGRFDVLLSLFLNAVMAKPHWMNFDRIMKVESEHDFKSTFYWLVNEGKIDARQTNADYDIHSGKVKAHLALIRQNGFENGLHKSISNDSFQSELTRMPEPVTGNRYHYLKFQLPGAYKLIEESGLKLDASLGFAEHYGFRNNYGYPFHPYNTETNDWYSFIEVPLTVMDGTFQRYMKVPVEKTADTVIDFLEKNANDALISILWHNTFFTDYKYKGYLQEYKKILQYLYEMKFTNINQSGIIKDFVWQRK